MAKVGDWVDIRGGDRGPLHKLVTYELLTHPSEEEVIVAFVFSRENQEKGESLSGMQFRCDIDETVKMLSDLIVGLENQKHAYSKSRK